MDLFTRETHRPRLFGPGLRIIGLLAVLLWGFSGVRAQSYSSSYSSSGYGSSLSSYGYGFGHRHRGKVKLAKKKKLILARARLARFGMGGGLGLGGGLGIGQGSIGGALGSHSTASLMMRAAAMSHHGAGASTQQMRRSMTRMRLQILTGGQGLGGTAYGANSIVQMRHAFARAGGHPGADLLKTAELQGLGRSQLHRIADLSPGSGRLSGGNGGSSGGSRTSGGNPMPNVATYVLGPGDVIRITVENHQEYDQDSITIPPDGYLRLPFFDHDQAVMASGKTVPQVRELLRLALAKTMRNPIVAVTPEAFRTTTLGQVFVIGAVKTPQPVDIKAGYRVTEVLAAVGGVDGRPEEMRALLTRAKMPVRTLDLHELISYPNSSANVHVLPNDVITITPIDPGHIAVLGAVARPGVYDLREKPQAGLFEIQVNPHLRDAIVAAGGLSSGQGSGDSKSSQAAPPAYRATLVRGNETIPLHLMEAVDEKDHDANIALENGDFINIEMVPPVPPITVYVDGQVKAPGSYQIPVGTGLLEAVAQAGGLAESDDRLVATVRRGGTELPVDLHSALYTASADTPLQDKDLVQINETPGMRVMVMGQVGKPAELRMNPNARVIDALALCGGLSIPTDAAHIMVIRQRPNGTQARLSIDATALEAGDLAQNATLQPGDVVDVSQIRSKSIFISGEVKTPGEYSAKGIITLPDLIAQAGGPTDKARLMQVQVQRDGNVTVIDTYGALKEGQPLNYELEDGDLVVVPTIPETLTVLDGVIKPGHIRMPEKGTFTIADAIQTAGGPRPNAKLDRVALLRHTGTNADGKQVFTEQIVNLSDRTNPNATVNLPLQADDIVYVPQSAPSQNKLTTLIQVISGAIDLKVLSGY